MVAYYRIHKGLQEVQIKCQIEMEKDQDQEVQNQVNPKAEVKGEVVKEVHSTKWIKEKKNN